MRCVWEGGWDEEVLEVQSRGILWDGAPEGGLAFVEARLLVEVGNGNTSCTVKQMDNSRSRGSGILS